MATKRFEGGAAAVAQVNTLSFGGTFVAGDIVTARCGNKIHDFVLTQTTPTLVVAELVTAWAALNEGTLPELVGTTGATAAIGATVTNLVLTAATPGIPFTITLETDSAAGTIAGDVVATAGTATTVSSGPYDVSTAANYSDGALPANGDTLWIDAPGTLLLYGLNALAAVTTLTIYAPTDAKIGLPPINREGTEYPEYRPLYLVTAGATLVNIGSRDGTGSSRVQMDFGSALATVNVFASQAGEETGMYAVQLKGTNAANVLTVAGGEVDVARPGGESATIFAYKQLGGVVRMGAGVTYTAAGQQYAGSLELNSAIATSHTITGGDLTINGTGAVAQLTARGPVTVAYNTSGALGGHTVVADGVLTFDGDARPKTITFPIEVYGTGQVIDTNKVAGNVAQVQSYEFGGTWEADDVIRVETTGAGDVSVDFVAGSTTIADVIDAIVTAWLALDADTFPEFAKVTPSRDTSTLLLTAKSPGTPFVFVLTPLETGGTAADAQTIEGVGVATLGTTDTANAVLVIDYTESNPNFGLGSNIRVIRTGVA